MNKSPVSPSFLKQKAKQLKKEKSISQSQALDEAAIFFGYSNYKNYLNISKAKHEAETAFQESLEWLQEERLYTEKNAIAMKSRQATWELIEKINLQFYDFFNDLKKAKKSIQSICSKNDDLKKYLQLFLLQDFLNDESCEIDSYAPAHIAKKVSLKNLKFKFYEDELFVSGDYDLTLVFAFEIDRNDPIVKNDLAKRFDDKEMFGSFEFTIDKDSNITIEDMDIGHYW